MTGFDFNQAAMAAGSSKVGTASGDIQRLISELRGEVETMMASWHGPAGDAFTRLHAGFEGQALKLNQSLQSMQQALDASKQTYVIREQSQAGDLTRLAGQVES